MFFVAVELLSLVICGMQLAGIGAQRCVTDYELCGGSKGCQFNRDGSQRLTLSGKIFSYESGCNAPIGTAAVRLYLGCVNSEFYEAEPFAEWKTDRDGAFQVTVPYKRDQTGVVRTEFCLEPRRSCRSVTLAIIGAKPVSDSAPNPVSGSALKPVSAREVSEGSIDYTANVIICLNGKSKRHQRSIGLDDRDMNWLKRGLKQGASAKEGRKRGWSNGIPWFKGIQGKRLWEGADEEVGWIKRQDHKDLHEGSIRGTWSNDTENPHSGEQPSIPTRSLQRLLWNEQLPVQRQRSVSKMAAWLQQPETKKYWAESDMSWL